MNLRALRTRVAALEPPENDCDDCPRCEGFVKLEIVRDGQLVMRGGERIRADEDEPPCKYPDHCPIIQIVEVVVGSREEVDDPHSRRRCRG